MRLQISARPLFTCPASTTQLCSSWRSVSRLHYQQKHVRLRAATHVRRSIYSSHRIRTTKLVTARPYSTAQEQPWTKAYVALGSNQGERLALIEAACWTLFNHESIKLLRTSLLYETAPMYVADQDPFLNAACEIETCLPPMQLLDELQAIEQAMGRVKTIDKGPRNIDLDILLYGDEKVATERLIVPHKLMHEREFVLRPLADLIPEKVITALDASRPIKDYLADLSPSDPPLSPIVPFGPGQFLRPLDRSRKTILMSILNVTPDSFSDGGRFVTSLTEKNEGKFCMTKKSTKHELSIPNKGDIVTARQIVLQNDQHRRLFRALATAVADGGDILDIGGQSSRPGAASITAEQEIDRIRPAMAIRAMFFPSIPTSVDTYRAQVAKATPELGYQFPVTTENKQPHIEPGAHIVNDISAGLLDGNMLSTVAKQRQTIVLMHMRGTPETMNKLTDYPEGVVKGVAEELKQRVAEAEAAGIPRWRIVLDPGIGFAKTAEQNWELLRSLNILREWDGLRGLPWLVGTSRKRFMGDALAKDDEVVLGRAEQMGSESGLTGALEAEWAGVANEAREKIGAGEREGMHDPKIRRVDLRDIGTAATVAAAVQGGADVVRVHETRIARDVIAVADAIWRRP
ncbi:Dihydropteroate synthase-like protein [Elsinoe ampelina]|uniref:Dihydropteroate synthase-like protein n=1 Tax=Elsinoe ampelina TaxID=302913 RepID=A0A6A6GEE5_9PEZI|nr:Dihydropteroate synthase-like protein [Elsinoe ampelina]